jgi:hypothetical protein
MFYDIKGVIRNRKSKTGNTTPCSKEKKRQKENQIVQISTQNTKARATRTPLRTGVNSDVAEG